MLVWCYFPPSVVYTHWQYTSWSQKSWYLEVDEKILNLMMISYFSISCLVYVMRSGVIFDRFMGILKSVFVSARLLKSWGWGVFAGLITGFCSSFMLIFLVGFLRKFKSYHHQLSVTRWLALHCTAVRLKRVCFFVAYVSFSSWLAMQYLQRIGLPDVRVHYSR